MPLLFTGISYCSNFSIRDFIKLNVPLKDWEDSFNLLSSKETGGFQFFFVEHLLTVFGRLRALFLHDIAVARLALFVRSSGAELTHHQVLILSGRGLLVESLTLGFTGVVDTLGALEVDTFIC